MGENEGRENEPRAEDAAARRPRADFVKCIVETEIEADESV